MDIFTVLFYQPIYNLIVVFYRLFSENLGLAIVAIALISKIIMFPLIMRQTKMMGKNMEASDKMKEIKEKYKNDKTKQNEELMKVNSEYMPALLGGCLPLIVQLVLFINIDHVIRDIFSKGASSFDSLAYGIVPAFPADYQIHTSFFGIVDLGKTANEIGLGSIGPVLPYLILIALTGITQFVSMKLSFKGQNMMKDIRAKYAKEDKKKKDKKKDPNAPEEFGDVVARSTQQTMFLFPVLLILGALGFPIGLSIYWIAQGAFGIIQQLYVNKVNAEQLEAEFVKKQAA